MIHWNDDNDPTAPDGTTLIVAGVCLLTLFLIFAEGFL